jgi:Cu/Ag efflux protein CusF
MKKAILLVVLLTLVAFVSGAIAAAPPKAAGTTPAPAAPASTKPVKLEKFTGDIKSVDAAAKTIVVARGKESKTFVVDEKTTITRGKDTLSLGDLKQGLNVSIEFKKEMDKLIAVTIKAGKPKGAPK